MKVTQPEEQQEPNQIVKKLEKLYRTVDCKNLHHNKNQYHQLSEDCPVEKEINDIIVQLILKVKI